MDEDAAYRRASLVCLAELAQEGERHLDALDFMAQLSTQLKENAGKLTGNGDDYYYTLTWDELELLLSIINAVVTQEVMPLVRVASDALFEAQMTVQRRSMGGEEERRTRTQAALRTKVARALLERAQARLESLSTKCLGALAALFGVCNPESAEDRQLCSSEKIVSYLTLKGDMLNFLASSHDGATRAALAAQAHANYQLALNQEELFSCNPARLRLARSLARFHDVHLARPDEAVRIANKAFDAALEGIDRIGEDSYKQVSVILQDLRNNALEWASTVDDSGGTADDFAWVTATH